MFVNAGTKSVPAACNYCENAFARSACRQLGKAAALAYAPAKA